MVNVNNRPTAIAGIVMLAGFLSVCVSGSPALAQSAATEDAGSRLETALSDELGFRDVLVTEDAGRVSIAFRPATDDEHELRVRLLVAVLAGQEFVPDSARIQVILHKEGLPVGMIDVPTSSVKGLLEGTVTAEAFFDSWQKTAFPAIVPKTAPVIRVTPGDPPASSDDSPPQDSDFTEAPIPPAPAAEPASPSGTSNEPSAAAGQAPAGPPTTTPAQPSGDQPPVQSPPVQTPIPPPAAVQAPSSPAAQPRLLLSEDFSQGPGNWLINGQPPTIRNGRAYFVGGDNRTLGYTLHLPIENFAVEFDGYCNGERINVLIANENIKLYAASIRRGATILIAHDPTHVREFPAVFEPGKWHHYRLVRAGDQFELFCDGERVAQDTFAAKLQGPGILGFSSQESTVGLDNIRFYDLAPVTAAEDVPPAKATEGSIPAQPEDVKTGRPMEPNPTERPQKGPFQRLRHR